MSDNLARLIRFFVCGSGIMTGLWLGDKILHSDTDLHRMIILLIYVSACGIVGWINGSFSSTVLKPNWNIIGYVIDLISGVVLGCLMIFMYHALVPASMQFDIKKCAWVFWISGALAFIVGVFNSAEVSVGEYHP